MNQIILAKLKKWRTQKADLEKCELFRIFQNKTLEDIATLLPKTKEEFLAIKGVGEKKFQKYGKEIFSFINEDAAVDAVERILEEKNQTFSVSDYLDSINGLLSQASAKIKGEVSSVSFKGHLYFSLKDQNDGSVISCFMWVRNYEICGVQIVEGMELIIHGFPEIYKPNGKFTFKVSAVELVGEGALKLAYEELKRKLEADGLFDEARKKPLPEFPHHIGLITSRDGAVINDFMSNIGNFGYRITFMDSRVEGMLAVNDLIKAVKFFKDKPIDVLVMIRGGGSLESLQAFNNEALLREVASLSMPVICGIGHDKDMPLLSYVADRAVSTPSIVAKEINRSWEGAVEKLDHHETFMLASFEGVLRDARSKLENVSMQMREFYQNIFRKFEQYQQALKNFIININRSIKHDKQRIEKDKEELLSSFAFGLKKVQQKLNIFDRELQQNSPERQLKLGYSIVKIQGKIVKSVTEIKKGDVLENVFHDGKIQSTVGEILNN